MGGFIGITFDFPMSLNHITFSDFKIRWIANHMIQNDDKEMKSPFVYRFRDVVSVSHSVTD